MLEDFIKVNKLSAQVFECKDSHTAAKAIKHTSNEETVAKSIVLVDPEGNPLLVILLGKDKIDLQKVKKALAVHDARLATPKEVLDMTGYEVGGVPPISIYGIRTLIDTSVAEKTEIVCGGGDSQHLMRIKVPEIMENAEDTLIADIKK